MKVPLGKRFILQLYCYSFQAERSIAFALGANWSEFRAYYEGDRINGVRLLAARVNEVAARNGIGSRSWTREEADRLWSSVGLFQYLFGRWITKWKKSWSFSHQEFSLMASTLNALVNVLDAASKPEPDVLIALRMNLCLCRSIIEDRCYGLAEIKRARWLEHFWQADWIIPVQLTDILGEHLQEKPSTRRSA